MLWLADRPKVSHSRRLNLPPLIRFRVSRIVPRGSGHWRNWGKIAGRPYGSTDGSTEALTDINRSPEAPEAVSRCSAPDLFAHTRPRSSPIHVGSQGVARARQAKLMPEKLH